MLEILNYYRKFPCKCFELISNIGFLIYYNSMDDDIRTVWCGNLSNKVTEEILYELFLQGGPIQRVSIPKDRDGKQRSYGFITYKHVNSVSYALQLFDGTSLFNRFLNMSPRKNAELPPAPPIEEHSFNIDHMLQLGQQMLLGNDISSLRLDPFGMNMLPSTGSGMNQRDMSHSYKDDRKSRRAHPYHREQNKSNNHKNHRHRDNHNNHRSNEYSRHGYKNSRSVYH